MDRFLAAINGLVQVEHSLVELGGGDFEGVQIDRAYIITSRGVEKTAGRLKKAG